MRDFRETELRCGLCGCCISDCRCSEWNINHPEFETKDIAFREVEECPVGYVMTGSEELV